MLGLNHREPDATPPLAAAAAAVVVAPKTPPPPPEGLGKTVQVDPIQPMLKAPGTKHLTMEYDKLLSNSSFIFNLRRYTWVPSPPRPSSPVTSSRCGPSSTAFATCCSRRP
jgi:hypothetical protein